MSQQRSKYVFTGIARVVLNVCYSNVMIEEKISKQLFFISWWRSELFFLVLHVNVIFIFIPNQTKWNGKNKGLCSSHCCMWSGFLVTPAGPCGMRLLIGWRPTRERSLRNSGLARHWWPPVDKHSITSERTRHTNALCWWEQSLTYEGKQTWLTLGGYD